MQEGVLTAEIIDKLTLVDVPTEWKSVRSVVETDTGTVVTFKRGEDKVLEVRWAKKWTEKKTQWFACSVYTQGKRSAVIIRVDSLSVMPEFPASEVNVLTSIADNGAVTVSLFKADRTLVESIVVDGRNTHLMDDLEFTKAKFAEERVVRPMLEAMGAGIQEGVRQKIDPR